MFKNLRVTVDLDHLSYTAYPVALPDLAALKSVKAADIELIFAGITEFQILLKSGDVLLFPKEKEIALREFVRRNGLVVARGLDPWNLLTDPYLDTEFTAAEKARTAKVLSELGFDAAEVAAIHKAIGPAVSEYNYHVWEWASLGLAEVLFTYGGSSEDAYRWVTAISKRGYAHAKPFDFLANRSAEATGLWMRSAFGTLIHAEEFSRGRAGTSAKPMSWWRRFTSRKDRADEFHESFRACYEKLETVRTWVEQRYAEPQRRYHTLEHIVQVISLLKSFGPDVTTAALLAGWFHDAIYDPRNADNEDQSAAAMLTQLEPLEVTPATLAKAQELILYTKHHGETADPEEQMIHDADLAIFGMDHASYAKYAADIRQEYAFVPDEVFRADRTRILSGFLDRAQRDGGFFYRLDPIFETQVAPNLHWELSQLSPG